MNDREVEMTGVDFNSTILTLQGSMRNYSQVLCRFCRRTTQNIIFPSQPVWESSFWGGERYGAIFERRTRIPETRNPLPPVADMCIYGIGKGLGSVRLGSDNGTFELSKGAASVRFLARFHRPHLRNRKSESSGACFQRKRNVVHG